MAIYFNSFNLLNMFGIFDESQMQSREGNQDYRQVTYLGRTFSQTEAAPDRFPVYPSMLEEQGFDGQTEKEPLTINTGNANRQRYHPSTKVFFKCLPRMITKEEIYSQFSRFGRVLQIRLPFSKKKHKYIGYGFVVFESAATAAYLIQEIKTLVLCGKPIELQSYKDDDGSAWQDLKQIDELVDNYILTAGHAMEGSFMNSRISAPISRPIEDPHQGSSYYAKWKLHSIKPCHSSYFSARKLLREPQLDANEEIRDNLLYRVNPSFSK